MIVVDTSALIAIIKSGREATQFQQLLLNTAEVLLAAPTKFETLMVLHGLKLGDAQILGRNLILQADIRIVEWTDQLADESFAAFSRYGKGQHPAKLNFGDCMSYALAKSLGVPLLYKGDDFAKTDVIPAAAASV